MRLWSLHPKYLDSKGLVAAWREGLLAQKCLAGLTKGYTNHPQLNRFKDSNNSKASIATFLTHIAQEADRRAYRFDSSKIHRFNEAVKMTVTKGQLNYEWQHFLKKIMLRDPKRYQRLVNIDQPEAHPIFEIVEGEVEDWEK